MSKEKKESKIEEMEEIKIMVIEALDHYQTQNPDHYKKKYKCKMRVIGEFLREDEDYIYLRNAISDINFENSAEDIQAIVKSTIKQKAETIIKWKIIKPE